MPVLWVIASDYLQRGLRSGAGLQDVHWPHTSSQTCEWDIHTQAGQDVRNGHADVITGGRPSHKFHKFRKIRIRFASPCLRAESYRLSLRVLKNTIFSLKSLFEIITHTTARK